jgi:hypothetical protein
MDRPENIEETADLVTAAGGTGIAVAVDHLVPEHLPIRRAQGRSATAADRGR